MSEETSISERPGGTDEFDNSASNSGLLSNAPPESPRFVRSLYNYVQEGSIDEVDQFVKQWPTHIDKRDELGCTALWISSNLGIVEITRLLLKNYATVDAINLLGETPLFVAARNGFLEILQLLISSNATLDYPAMYGFTPLIVAASKGHLECVVTLVDNGGCITQLTDAGKTAATVATEAGHELVAKYLMFQQSIVPKLAKKALSTGSKFDDEDEEPSSPSSVCVSPRKTLPFPDLLRLLRTSARIADPPSLRDEDFTLSAARYHVLKTTEGAIIEMKAFSPKVFAKIRAMSGYSQKAYIDSWKLSLDQMTLSLGAGRSGSHFCYSTDKKFIMKTIPHDEVYALMTVIHEYYRQLTVFPDSLIMRVCGLYRFNSGSWDSLYVIVFGNIIFCETSPSSPSFNLAVSQERPVIFDLKGRVPKKGKLLQRRNENETIWKDKDLERFFWLPNGDREEFLEQLQRDVDFLARHNLMDYSLLIGIRHIPSSSSPCSSFSSAKISSPTLSTPVQASFSSPSSSSSSSTSSAFSSSSSSVVSSCLASSSSNSAASICHSFNEDSEESSSNCGKMLKFRSTFGGCAGSQKSKEILYLGIIDCLTFYSGKKKVANLCKSILWTSDKLSTVPAVQYAGRFMTYMKSIFPPQESPLTDLIHLHPNHKFVAEYGVTLRIPVEDSSDADAIVCKSSSSCT